MGAHAHGGCTLTHRNIPEGLQLVESPHQSRFFLTAIAVQWSRGSVRRKD